MTGAWKIWQGWTIAVASVLLFIAPWVFSATGDQNPAWTAWIAGVLGFAAALWLLAQPRMRWLAVVSFVIGVLVFIAPWVLGFTALTGIAWAAWILGAVMAVVAATAFLTVVTARRHALSH